MHTYLCVRVWQNTVRGIIMVDAQTPEYKQYPACGKFNLLNLAHVLFIVKYIYNIITS